MERRNMVDIVSEAKNNTYFRKVLTTNEHTQIVVMSIPANEDIGLETHPDNDQILYLVSGNGKALLDGQESKFKTGDLVAVPAGTEHHFITTGDKPMKIITIYSPPHHAPGTIHPTKADAEMAEAEEERS